MTTPSPFRTPSAGGVYLHQALDALRDAGSADTLYRELDPFHRDAQLLGPLQHTLNARNRRLWFLRSAVLFAAIAAEAYANEFLEATLSRADVDAVDRLTTVDKLILGPRLAGMKSPLDRGSEPLQSITLLFRARSILVHPRPGGSGPYVHVLTDADHETFGPAKVVRYIEAVAHAAVLLHPLRPDRPYAAPASRIWEERAVMHNHVAQLGDDLLAIPPEDGPPVAPLMNQMDERAIKRGKRERAQREESQRSD